MISIYNILKKNRKILILGFGKEGRSSYRVFRSLFPERMIWIGDEDNTIKTLDEFASDKNITWRTGSECYSELDLFDLIIKTPGIPMRKLTNLSYAKITSQTDLFLTQYHNQVIGISGTKGKSTTSSLIHHILKESGVETMLVGNIGVPAFDLMKHINSQSIIIMELSAHQGEILKISPSCMVLLNIFQEHLDHFGNFKSYRDAKLNFCTKQQQGDTLIYFSDDPLLSDCKTTVEGVKYIPLSAQNNRGVFFSKEEINGFGIHLTHPKSSLKGTHNLINIAAAVTVAHETGISESEILKALASYKPLEHRLEYVGSYNGIKFYNDSISTVPQAAIAAMEALKDVKWILLGGFDRGIPYAGLTEYLAEHEEVTLCLLGNAGVRIKELAMQAGISQTRLFNFECIEDCLAHVTKHESTEAICLLSPAASSYDRYKNFEERGSHFKEIVKTYIDNKP